MIDYASARAHHRGHGPVARRRVLPGAATEDERLPRSPRWPERSAALLARGGDAGRTAVAGLQSSHGNRHAQRAIARRVGGPVQRAPRGPNPAPGAVIAVGELDPGVTIGIHALPLRQTMVFNGGRLNDDALDLFEDLARSAALGEEWRDEVGFLKMSEGRAPEDLAAVKKAAPAVGKAAKDEKGEYTQNAVQGYVRAHDNLSAKMPAVRAAQAGIAVAAGRAHGAILAAAETKAAREVTAAEGSVADEKAKIAERKRRAGIVLGAALKLADPTMWANPVVEIPGLASGVAGFIGTELIEGDDESVGLFVAQTQLKAAQAKLTQIQDDRNANALQVALDALEQATEQADAVFREFKGVVREVGWARATLDELLRKGGRKGVAAAEAIDHRAEAKEGSVHAMRLLGSFDEVVKRAERREATLRKGYATVSHVVATDTNSVWVPDPDERTALVNYAAINESQLAPLAPWLAKQHKEADEARGYVQGESFLTSYDQIDDVLDQALLQRNKPTR